MKKFKVRLTSHGPGGAWTFLEVPVKVAKAFGSKGRICVAGTLNGSPFQNSLMPNGDGTHSLMANKALQSGAKARAGDLVSVTLSVDRSERVVTIASELRTALAKNSAAARASEALSYSHRKEFAEWITTAKRVETRVSRAWKSIPMVLAHKHVR
jgi:hypothetical protein